MADNPKFLSDPVAVGIQRGEIEVLEGERGGYELKRVQLPLDHYLKSRIISKAEWRAGGRIFKDFYNSGQTASTICNLNPVHGSGDSRQFLPASDLQREALDNWRNAIDSIQGKIGQLMVLNVCCFGWWLGDMKYLPYNPRSAMFRFREALGDLIIHYKKS